MTMYVGWVVQANVNRGGKTPFGPSWPSGFLLTRVRVRAKLIFPSEVVPSSGYPAGGQWGNAIQVGFNGVSPNRWDTNPQDSSIWAFDNAEPEGLERVFWAPSTDSANVTVSFTSALEWRGQFRTTVPTQFYYVPLDVLGTAAQFSTTLFFSVTFA